MGYCPSLQVRRASLAARLSALDAEAGDIRRREAQDDRVTTQRDVLLADPVTSRLAALLGTTAARVDLLSGLMFAAVLEGVACLLWVLALGASPLPVPAPFVSASTLTAVAPVDAVTDLSAETKVAVTVSRESHADETTSLASALPSHDGRAPSRAPRDDPLAPLPDIGPIDDDLSRLILDVTAGHVRPTVADIRRHLGCSQAKATTLRRQLAARHAIDGTGA